jgi:hypothetical protein
MLTLTLKMLALRRQNPQSNNGAGSSKNNANQKTGKNTKKFTVQHAIGWEFLWDRK